MVDLGPDPPVVDGLDGAELSVGKWRQFGGGRILLRLTRVARPGDDGGHARLLDHPGQGGLSWGRSWRRQCGELAGRVDTGIEVDAGERLARVERLTMPVVAAVIG